MKLIYPIRKSIIFKVKINFEILLIQVKVFKNKNNIKRSEILINKFELLTNTLNSLIKTNDFHVYLTEEYKFAIIMQIEHFKELDISKSIEKRYY